ncbi:MAG: hypothetical protein ACYDBQ_11520 [Thermoplasmatota archaeon]
MSTSSLATRAPPNPDRSVRRAPSAAVSASEGCSSGAVAASGTGSGFRAEASMTRFPAISTVFRRSTHPLVRAASMASPGPRRPM